MPLGWAALLAGIASDASHIPQAIATHWIFTPTDILWSFTGGIVNSLAAGCFWWRSRNLPATILLHMLTSF
jgi:membrane protease YdiL (CAAX protease family)